MRTERKTQIKNGIARLIFVCIGIAIQGYWIGFLVNDLNAHYKWVSPLVVLASVILALYVFGRHTSASIKIPWIILILALPFVGVVLYILIGINKITKKGKKRFAEIDAQLLPFLPENEEELADMRDHSRSAGNISGYLRDVNGFPVYKHTDVTFFADTCEALEAQKEALRGAEHFIFMEYYAIEEARAFGQILSILEEKVKEGVEVRLFYDDIGSISFINTDFIRRMENKGIQCRVFNRMMPILDVFMNNRDHRKMMIVDGRVGFTGGYNLADEYFNYTHPCGQWKDSGIRLTGEAVRTMTMLFLEMWTSIHHSTFYQREFRLYFPEISYQAEEEAFVSFYGDTPLREESTGESVYMLILNRAKEYVYITTPYLLITEEMTKVLCLTAKRGIDVRIVTPGIPDKKIIFQMTRSYYAELARCGVRIFEYTPGFCHAKQCVSDDMIATVGTINMDFRSFYSHFEDGCYFYNCRAVHDVKADMEHLFAVSREVTAKYAGRRNRIPRIVQCVLRLIAPLF